MADWTAITGIIVSGFVGPAGAAYFTGRHQQRAFDRDRSMQDRVELRTLLDEAAVALHEAVYAGSQANSAVLQHGRWVGERAPEVVAALRDAGKVLDRLRERMQIRLGGEEKVVQALAAADEHLLEFFRALTLLADLGPNDTADLLKESRDRMTPAFEGFQQEGNRFIELAAHPDVGGLLLKPPARSLLPWRPS